MSDEVTVWIDADGGTTALDVQWNTRGRFMPKVEFESDGVPGQPGEFFRSARHGVHELILPLWITADTDGLLRTTMRDLVDKMDPTRGPGKLRVTSPLGDQRELECFYAAGLEMDETVDDSSGLTWQKAAVSFTAYDPYWYDVSPTSKMFTITELPLFFPIFPLHLTASEIVVDDTITNSGSVETWPVWTVTGPGSVIKLINLTTGQYLYFPNTTLGTGQSITIDTRPGIKSVLLDDGSSVYSELDPTSSLWPLARSMNSISLELSGAAPSASALQVSYWQRYLSP